MVAPLTSNVCIKHHAALNAIHVCVKQFVMSLPAKDWFSVSRKGGTGGGGLAHTPKGESSMAVLGFGCAGVWL